MKYSRAFLPSFAVTTLLLLAACGDEASSSSSSSTSSSTAASTGSATVGVGGAGGQGGAGAGGQGGQGGAAVDILDRLQSIAGATVVEDISEIDGYRFFVIEFDQPVDHENPTGQHFKQRIALHHRDDMAPTVLATTGYMLWLPTQYLEEPASMVGANQLVVEHRYFTPSRPEPADWSKLTIKQAAADHHRIVEAFKTIYPGKWVSTGASKGGMTSVYHRRFYPADLDGTIAYVAPHSNGLDDQRYAMFLAQVGDASCRTKLHDFEREVLLRRTFITGKMTEQAMQYNLTYNFYGVDAALEGSVAYLSWSFWQYFDASRCADVPPTTAPDDAIWAFFDEIASPWGSADDSTLTFEPYNWQAESQLGTPGVDLTHLQDLFTVDQSMLDSFPSIDGQPTFDPAAMQDVGNWLATEGKGILFVYGGDDPWTAGAFELGAAQDSYRFFAPGKNHGAAIADLEPADKAKAEEALAAWTGVTPGQFLKAPPASPKIDIRKVRRLRPR